MVRPADFVLNGRLYDLTHLSGFVVQTTTQRRPNGISVYCSFSHHCFTTAAETEQCSYAHEGEYRDFCPNRYAWSLRLPDLIRNAVAVAQDFRVFVSSDKNGARKFVIIEDHVSGDKYHAYFDTARSTLPYADIKMTIASAYLRPVARMHEKTKLGTVFDRQMGLIQRQSKKRRGKK